MKHSVGNGWSALLGVVALTSIAAIGCTGCSKNADAGTAEPSAAPAASACTPEHLKVEKHKFCIKLGPKWKHDAASDRVDDGTTELRFKIDEPPYDSLHVKVFTTVPMVTAESIKDTIGRSAGAELTTGEFLGGRGYWALSKSEAGKVSTYSVYIQGAGNLVYNCGSSGPTPPSGTPVGLEQCKTIVPLD